MAYHFQTNLTPATWTLCVYQCITVLLAAGWTKIKDSDGTTYSSSGVQVTSGAAGAGGLNNASAWVNLKAPGAASDQLCFQRGTASDVTWRVTFSPVAGFAGGTPGATRVPTATDSILCLGGGTDAAPTYATWFSGTEGSCRYNAGASDLAPYTFWCQGWPTGGGTGTGGMFFDGTVNGIGNDNDPHVYCLDTAGFSASSVTAAAHVFGNQPSVNTVTTGMSGVSFPFVCPTNGLSTDPITSKDQLRPLEYYPLLGYYKGQTVNIYWEMTGTTGNPRNLGYTLTLNSTGDTVIVGVIALPWDGSTPLI